MQVRPVWVQPRPSQFFTWADLVVTSRPELQDHPASRHQRNLVSLCVHFLDPLARHVGRPMWLSSAYRSQRLNAAIGGASRSRHKSGCGADFGFEGMTSFDVAHAVVDAGLSFDKLIAYHPEAGGHVHASYLGPRYRHRQQVFQCFRQDGRKVYRAWPIQ